MKKSLRALIVGIAFMTTTFFMSCSSAISYEEQQQISEQTEEIGKIDDSDSSRCCYGGHRGHTGGNSISDGHCSNRGGRSGRGRR
jgi:hypothetical protein